MPAGIVSALADLASTFARLRVRWYVFGAQAVIAAGFPRLTADIDVTVELPRGGPRKLIEALASAGITPSDVGDLDSFIAETRVIPAVHTATGLPIDIVLAGPGLEEDMMARVITRTFGATKIPFVATADLIALKVLAGRDKDLEDVAGLLRSEVPDLSVELARQRVADLGAMVDDSTLVATFDRLVSARAKARAATPSTAKRTPIRAPKRKPR